MGKKRGGWCVGVMGGEAGCERVEYVSALLFAGGANAENSLDEPATGGAVGAIAGFAPKHRMPKCALGGVVRRLNAWPTNERPKIGLIL